MTEQVKHAIAWYGAILSTLNLLFCIWSTCRRRRETQALLQPRLKTTPGLPQMLIQAKWNARDAAAHRGLVERLTNELDQRKKG